MTYDWVGKWIEARQLTADALADEAAAFASRHGRWAVLDSFLPERLAQVLSRFLRHEVGFTTGLGVKDRYGFVSEAEFGRVDPADRFFRFGRLDHIEGAALESPGYRAYSGLTAAFHTGRVRAIFEAISGMRLGDVTLSARRMAHGDFLAAHTDDVEERLLSWVIYLTPTWERDHGGILHLDDGEGQTAEVEPVYNRLVLFDARTWHEVTPLARWAKGRHARVTLGGWYLRP